MHALALLDAFSALQPQEIEQALKDTDGRVRQNAVRLSERALKQSKPLANAVLAAAADSDPHVQFQAALTLGDLRTRKRSPRLHNWLINILPISGFAMPS